MSVTRRILSDLHYGDRSSQVRSLAAVAPLFDGVDEVIVNGDMLDTRAGPYPARTAELRDEVERFAARPGSPVRLLTGNHDPDISTQHSLDLAEGAVLVTHGDVLFDNIVPWGRDARLIRERIAAGLDALPSGRSPSLEDILGVYRVVAASLEQLHQAEPNPWKHLRSFVADTLWPPHKVFLILQTWRQAPERAAALARAHRPGARFVVLGHFHRPGIWRTRDGRWIINTGSFCRPLGGAAVELTAETLTVRRIVHRRGEFRTGPTLAEFALAEA